MTTSPKVYPAIAAVMDELSKEGIGKSRKNEQQGYKFRGIDEVFNALAPILAKNRLVIVPEVISREVVERLNQRGTPLFYVTCAVRFTLVSADDGSSIQSVTYGEAMDSGDKATNKAMSAAYKYMALQTFCIPTEGDNDADATTHEVAPKAWEPSAGARTAVNTLETFQRDPAGFKAFWNLNKDGLKAALDGEDYAWTVENMKRIAGTMPKAAPEPVKSANGHQAAVDALAGDEIPF